MIMDSGQKAGVSRYLGRSERKLLLLAG